MIDNNTHILFSIDQLKEVLREIIREELNANSESLFISPEDACKLFTPAISKPTLENYSKKGIVKKYYLGRRTWFKRGEITESLKSIKRFSRDSITNLEQVYLGQVLKKKGIDIDSCPAHLVEQQRNLIKFKREIKNI